MSTPTTPEQLAKLPKWASKYILNLERDVRIAEEKLKTFMDDSTESAIYVEEYDLGRRFIQAQSVTAKWAGVTVEIYLPRKGDSQREFGPEIKWHAQDRTDHIAMIPNHFQCVTLLAKENMR